MEKEEGDQTWIWRVLVKIGHTTSSWTWARMARETMEVPWARKYLLVGWDAIKIG